MTYREPERATARRTRWTIVAALACLSAALIGVLDYRSSSPSSSAPSSSAPSSPATSPVVVGSLAPRPHHSLQGPAGEADGVVPDGVTVFDDQYAAVAKLDPALRSALREAATDAAGDGVTFYVNSGWRSPRYQQQLLDQAISTYGSEAAAARWVATPSTSAHVTGNAVDIGRTDAATWLAKHGASYGLCQIYRNEAWHYELRPEAIHHGCPPMYDDPTQDPRMQQ